MGMWLLLYTSDLIFTIQTSAVSPQVQFHLLVARLFRDINATSKESASAPSVLLLSVEARRIGQMGNTFIRSQGVAIRLTPGSCFSFVAGRHQCRGPQLRTRMDDDVE